MPDERSTNWTTSDESFPAMAFERAKNPPKRRWTCPAAEAIAAYVDGVLSEETKRRLETHLAKCEWCRSIVADVIKLQRDVELPVPPFEATKKGLAVGPGVSTGKRWLWAPATMMAAAVLVAVIIVLRLGRQEGLVVVSPPTPSASIVARVEPVVPGKSPAHEITRRLASPNIGPVILSPSQDSTVNRDQLEIKWKPLSRSRNYMVTVVTSDGDLLWTGQTESSSMSLPSHVVLKHDSYFVWVTAYLTDGQVAKSTPVRFVVEP
jgi:hypothetical protein